MVAASLFKRASRRCGTGPIYPTLPARDPAFSSGIRVSYLSSPLTPARLLPKAHRRHPHQVPLADKRLTHSR